MHRVQTKASKRLAFENFDDPFVTHGIDVIPDPNASGAEAVYIVAVNHVPNQAVYPRDGSSPEVAPSSAPRGASRIDVFQYVSVHAQYGDFRACVEVHRPS